MTDVEADRDRDGIPDLEDNCPDDNSADVSDGDGDGLGDVCDSDDDDDGRSDAQDNCPGQFNPSQADANADGTGNVCDEAVRGASVEGVVDFSAGGNPQTSDAQVFITNQMTPVGINAEGAFIFEQALAEPSPFAVRVEWPGFVVFERVFNGQDGVPVIDVGRLVLVPEAADGEQAVPMQGIATLQGRSSHQGILIQASVGGVPVASTLTNPEGLWVLAASRVDHTLEFSAAGFVSEDVAVVWTGEHFEIDGQPLDEHEGVVLRPDRSATVSGRLTSELDIQDWDVRRRTARLVGVEGETALVVESDGDFTTSAPVQPGVYGLEFDIRGFLGLSRVVALDTGDNPQGDIALVAEFQVEDGGQTMTGRVCLQNCDDPDVDHSGTVVRAVIGLNLVAVVVTDTQGRFTLRTSGEAHELELSRSGYATEQVDVTFSDERQVFLLGAQPLAQTPIALQRLRNAALSGQISSPIPGQDFGEASVVLVDTVARRSLLVEQDGRFGEDGLAPGLYGMEVTLPGHTPLSRAVNILEGDNNLGRFEMVPIEVLLAGSVMTRVVEEGEEQEVPVEEVSVQLRRDGRLVATTLTDTSGDFVFEALPVGYTLTLSRNNFIPGTFSVSFGEEGFVVEGEALLTPDNPLLMLRAPESDRDSDGVIDLLDNCPQRFNNAQLDIDGDGAGDVCDADADGDGVFNGLDNCPLSPNPMQEDPDGLGRGAVCTLGSAERPIAVGCGVARQHLDTRERADQLRGSCGGVGTPEVVYELGVVAGESWFIGVEAQFSTTIYVLDELGREVDCVVGGRLQLGDQLPGEGRYTVVIDGFSGAQDAGPMEVNFQSLQACTYRLLEPAATFEVGNFPVWTTSGDLNGDGHLDLVAANKNGDDVTVLWGAGDGTFPAQDSFTAGFRPDSVGIADLDDNGHMDLITTNGGRDSGVSVLLGTGDGAFGEPTLYPIRSFVSPEAVVLTDLDLDGARDVVMVIGGSSDVGVLLGRGDGTLSPVMFYDVGHDNPDAVGVGDVNADGQQDILASHSEGVTVLLGSEGDFVLLDTFPLGTNPAGLKLGDVNADGHLDVATANFSSNDVSLVLGRGDGTFEPQISLPVINSPTAIELVDFDGDALLDIITLDVNTGNFSILFNLGRGIFSLPLTTPTVARGTMRHMGVADVDADGVPDVFAVAIINNVLSLNLGRRFGGVAPMREVPVGDRPSALVVEDIDGDGHLDLLTANTSGNNISVLMGDGAANFSPTQQIRTTRTPRDLAVADVNSDGRFDLIACNGDSNSLRVFLGDTDGRFDEEHESYSIEGFPHAVEVGDFNGDEHLDLLTANVDTDNISLLLNNGDGTFLPHQTFPVGDFPQRLAVADLNTDGALDVVVANRSSDTVSVLMGDGESFAPQISFAVGDAPSDVAIGDINGDGHLDILTPNAASDNISFLLGDGEGGFAPDAPLPVDFSPHPFDLALEDLDGNGAIDIVLIDFLGGASFLMADVDGAFRLDTQLQTGVSPYDVVIARLDDDEQFDVVIANRDSNSLGIYTARKHPTAATRLVQSALPSCSTASTAATEGPVGQPVFDNDELAHCRIDRLEFNLDFDSQAVGTLSLQTPGGKTLALADLPEPGASPGRWRPEVFDALARFETHPVDGAWVILADGFDVGEASMLINHYPADPFNLDTLAEICTSDVDQPVDPDEACRLGDTPLESLILEGEEDEDVFVLEGDFSGAFVRGQTLEVTLNTEPGADVLMELRAFRASRPLATARETQEGVWSLSYTIPRDYSGRYFSVHIQGRGVENLNYDLQASHNDLLD